ncbi:MAG: hypothetical protein CL920_25030 [Deltaproteobacteria bacterium]|nr:hypothetical protein [Deltaproteobacteria bacterium]MBU51969.1 hypothetical protein [Deltaproteobacteria bacterium]|tara:strand:+ start:1922 stop:2338 length:417 start_codon:yes stop_codon:yes gene_type:complete
MKINTTKLYLAFSGLIITLVGAFIAFSPVAYLQQFELGHAPQLSFLSEMRGMGGALVGYGLLSLLAVLVQTLQRSALITATLTFSAFSFFRITGILVDGLPGQGILLALTIECIFGLLGLILLAKGNGPSLSRSDKHF